MILAISITIVLPLCLLLACLKAASDEDDRMGYDDVVGERTESDGI